jgi:hypothetical protein
MNMANLVRRDATSTSGGELTTSAQTIPGAKTFTGVTTFSENTTGLLVTKWNASTALAGTDGSSGLYKAGSAPGLTTAATISSGYVGERPTLQNGTVTATTTLAQWASITLTPGVWLLSASASGFSGGGVGTYIQLCIATTGGNSTAGCTSGYDNVYSAFNNATTVGQAVIPAKYVNINASTTYYLNGRSDHVTASDIYYFLQAVRIA